MRERVELVLFDLGGTLFYKDAPWGKLYREADAELWRVLHAAGVALQPRQAYGKATTLFELYIQHPGSDLSETTMASFLDQLLRAKGIALDEQTLRAGLHAMFAVTQRNWRLEEDAIPALDRLKSDGLHIGAVSNGSDDDNTQTLVDGFGLRAYLEFLISSAAFGRRKPDPSIFRLALDHFGVPAQRAVMVGDDYEADVLGAHGVGMQAIWITRRVAPPLPETARGMPEAVVSTLREIPPILENW